MNIYDPYPDSVEVDGRVYKLDLAYDRVLRVMDIQDAEDLTPEDKITVSVAWLLGPHEAIPQDIVEQAKILQAFIALLPKSEGRRERYIDFHQDAALIRTAFFRIGVDLTKDKIHFFQFLELLADLPSDTALMRVVDIRQRPIPAANKHNREQIKALLQAKARVAIKYTEEEKRARFAEALKNSVITRG